MSKKDSSMNSKRQVMGTEAYSLADAPSSRAFKAGMVVKKGGAGKGGVPEAAIATPRHGVPLRTNGPRMSISVGLPNPVAPEASMTQGNGRILPSATRRSVDSFVAGRYGNLG